MNAEPASPSTRVILITGAARRIGRQIALHMAREGWHVAIHYGRSAAEAQQLATEIRALGQQAVCLQADLADEAATRQLVPQVLQQFGRLDCIVNNASLFEADLATDFNYANLQRHLLANTGAPLVLAQCLHASLDGQQQACVINLLDQKLWNLNPDFLSYTLSKAALQCATTLLAQALAPRLRVAGIAPGITMVSGHQSEADFAAAHQVTPLGRSSNPDDIARTVSFIANSPAITGTTLLVDGGQHLLPLQRDVMYLASAGSSK